MSKSRVVSCIIVALLVIASFLVNSRKLFLWAEEDNKPSFELDINENRVKKVDRGWEFSVGQYIFGGDLPTGLYDFETVEGVMYINGKKLNKGCTFKNFIAWEEGTLLVVEGDGTLHMIEEEESKKEMKGDNIIIRNSGYYLESMLTTTVSGEGKIRITRKDIPKDMAPVKLELQDYNTKEVLDKVELKGEIVFGKNSFEKTHIRLNHNFRSSCRNGCVAALSR